MKKILFLIVIFSVTSCSIDNKESNYNLRLKLSRKDLTKLFEGQELYSIKGVKSSFDKKNVRVSSLPSKNQHILLLDFRQDFYEGANEILLHSDLKLYKTYESLKWFINKNKLFWPQMKFVKIKFHENIKKNFVLIEIPSKETIEYNGNRFLQILSLSKTKERFELDKSETLSIINLLECYDYDYNSLALLEEFMKRTEVKLASFDCVKIIPNTITNKIQFSIDFKKISYDGNEEIDFSHYLNQIDKIKKIDHKQLNLAGVSFLKLSETNLKRKKYKKIIFKDNIEIYRDTILSNTELIVSKGTKIKLYNNAKIIIDQGIILFSGNENNPISVEGFGNNSILLKNIDSISLKHVNFSGLSNFNDDCIKNPASITIYNSSCNINYCNFSKNRIGDDMINLFSSTFTIKNSSFKDIISDAVDSDFSSGEISNSSFERIGNDAIDCSGTNLLINNVTFTKVSDKAVSAGENSKIDVINSKITNSAIGYVSKDGSILNITGEIIMSDNDLDFVVFQKKNFYKTASLHYDRVIEDYRYLFQEGSIIFSKDQQLKYITDVESKLYGKEYGKSSK
jgi:hypothetical protein